MKAAICAALLLLASASGAMAADEIEIERVTGLEHPPYYNHPATITQLRNGDLYIAFYGGSGEYERDTAVYGMRKKVGATGWGPVEIIADTPDRSDGNGAVWQAPDGLVWLFYVTNYGPTWSSARIKYKISMDGAYTWSDSDILSFEQGTMLRSAPIELKNGDYLLPVYHETGEDQERTASDTCSYFMRYNPKTKTWTETNRIFSTMGNLQAQPVQIDDNYLFCFIRRGGDFEAHEDGVVYRSESRDGGNTWGPGEPTQFPNPNSGVDLIKLKNGHLLLVYNHNNQGQRMPLTIAISTDNGQTWPHTRDIVNEPGDSAAYPTAIQSADEKIHIVYTSRRRTVVNHATFDESAILDHTREAAK